MLKAEDFNNLIMKDSVGEVAEYLKNKTYYKNVLRGVDIKDIHRDKLELLLKKHIVNQYEKLIHFFTDEYRKLFRILFIRYEIEDLKLYIRTLIRGEDLESVRGLVLYSGIYSTVDHDKLSKSKDIKEFVENLKDTNYYDMLKPYLNEEGRKLTFYMEMRLDRYYFKSLYDQSSKLDKNDQKIFKDLLGKNIDLLNLEWIYRGIKFYKLSSEELINYIIVKGSSMRYDHIKELCYSDNEKELMEKIVDGKYGFLFDNENTVDLFMERRIERYLYFQFKDYYRKGKMDIIESIAYMHLLEFEVRDIISTIEAIRYDLDKREAKKYLVRRLKGSDL